MKKYFQFFLVIFTLHSCVSVEKYNKKLVTPIPKEKLSKDIDFVQKKLVALHPDLYGYISEAELNYKFDSLKMSINKPLTPQEFFEKLAPVITMVREGHLALTPPIKKFTKKEKKKINAQKGLFSRMNFVVDKYRLFVKDNAEKFENISVGTEILKINEVPVKDYLMRYGAFVTGDGFNTTFKRYALAQRWAIYFTVENGILDSVKIQTQYQNKIKDFYIHREAISKKEKKEEAKIAHKIKEEEKTKDYNPRTKSFNRDLQFFEQDSSVAYIKIKSFSGTYSGRFYRESFDKIKKTKSKFLILDVRDNLGGSLAEVHNLYSYLALEKFQFIDDIEVTGRNSTLKADYFNHFSPWTYPFAVLGYPFYAAVTYLSNKEKNGKIYLKNNSIFSIKKPNKNAFDGKIFLLINGSSFSASSIIAAKLKADKRAILVGEETGGANDGTVAGRYSTVQLPYSGLKLPIGLMLIKPHIEFTHTQKGVTPNIEIVPTTFEVLQKKDLQLQRVQKEIKMLISQDNK